MPVKIELEKKEIDAIANSLAFWRKSLKRDLSKTKNLNSKIYKDKAKDFADVDKLLSDIYKIEPNASHKILFDLNKK